MPIIEVQAERGPTTRRENLSTQPISGIVGLFLLLGLTGCGWFCIDWLARNGLGGPVPMVLAFAVPALLLAWLHRAACLRRDETLAMHNASGKVFADEPAELS